MHTRIALLTTLVLLLAGAAGVAGWYYYLKKPPETVAVEIGEAKERTVAPTPTVKFTDVTGPAGITFRHENGLSGMKLLPETMGGGVAIIDFDRDGRQDLFFVNSCPWPGHQGRDQTATPVLYRNTGSGKFEDVTERYGLKEPLYGMGAAVGDFDNDSFPDLFISCVGQHRLYRNDGGKRFVDVTASSKVGGGGELPKCSWDEFLKQEKPIPFGSSATFLDYDGDGRLDLFVCHYVTWSPTHDLHVSTSLRGGDRSFAQPKEFAGSQCKLFRNVDGETFEDVSEKAGLTVTLPVGSGAAAKHRPVAKALGVVVCDPDEDGWPDVVVANDTVRNFFFHNVPGPDGTRKFQEDADRCSLAYADHGVPRGGMGIDWGEYLPGRFAVVVTNFALEPNTFFRQAREKSLRFSDAALAYGLAGPSRQPLKFGAFFFDYDLDGRLDLLTCNGHIEPDIASVQTNQQYDQPAQLFWNTGDTNPLYQPATAETAGADLFKPMVGRGSAYLDYDGDGDLDVVLVANGGPARLLRNDNALGHRWVRLLLEGDGKKSNRSAIGAQVTIAAGGNTYHRQVAGARGYLSQSEFPITIGLARAEKIDRVTVRWPGRDAGPPQVWENLTAGTTYELRQGEPAATARK